MASNNDRISKMSFAQETVQVPVTKKRGFDIDLNVALSDEEQDFLNSNENGCEIVEEEKSTVIVDPDEEKEMRNKRMEALLNVAEIKLREYEQKNRGKTQGKSLTRKKRATTRGVDELGGGSTRKNTFDEYNDDCVVVRSTRGRAVALPNKYRDSVLEPVAELPRVKRKSRLSRDSK